MTEIESTIREVEETLVILREQRGYPPILGMGVLMQIKSEEIKLTALREMAERKNPLPLEELKVISQDLENRRWVWIKLLEKPYHSEIESAYYRVQRDYTKGRAFCCGYPGYGVDFDYADYGVTWLAYDHEPGEGDG